MTGKEAAPAETAPNHQHTNTDKDAGKSHSNNGDGAVADLIDYFEACGFGDQSGWLVIRWGREPYLDKNWNYKHGDSAEFGLRWPDEAEGTLPAILKMAYDGDVYVCPYLRQTRGERKKGDAVSLSLVHCDVDIYVEPALQGQGQEAQRQWLGTTATAAPSTSISTRR
jgi:hypothetical protein